MNSKYNVFYDQMLIISLLGGGQMLVLVADIEF